ncbi:MAG: dinitrogenase iron-molybdenum cofactor biosynthesis protein [Clostridia bacterium]|nr:dinitrogenase iron-molybdenum cofactor biosynthesis protein [Clostridia bacterium]
MAIRAAVASTDGKVINCHFGKASQFLIFELHSGGFEYIENRQVTPCCNRGEHEDNSFENAAKELGDCSMILVSKIGLTAADFLESRGFAVYEAPFPIKECMEKLAAETEVD